jgi:hypothetical protein
MRLAGAVLVEAHDERQRSDLRSMAVLRPTQTDVALAAPAQLTA